MKYVKASVFFFVLVFAPLVSYFYLKSGLDFRLNQLEETAQKLELTEVYDWPMESEINQDTFSGMITVLIPSDIAHQLSEELDIFKEKYRHRPDFQILVLPELYAHQKQKDGRVISIVDLNAQVRHQYTTSPEDIQKLDRHIAVLLPVEKHKKVKLKRELEHGENK